MRSGYLAPTRELYHFFSEKSRISIDRKSSGFGTYLKNLTLSSGFRIRVGYGAFFIIRLFFAEGSVAALGAGRHLVAGAESDIGSAVGADILSVAGLFAGMNIIAHS